MAAPASVPQPTEGGQEQLRRFRADFYDCLPTRPDGLFELIDGLCCPVPVAGVAHLTLAPALTAGTAAPTPLSPKAPSTPICYAMRWPRTGPPAGYRTSPWTPRPGRAATRNAHPAGVSTTTRPGTRPGNPSWPAGRICGSPPCPRRPTRGPHRPTRTASPSKTTSTPSPWPASKPYSRGWAGYRSVRCSPSTPVSTRSNSPSDCPIWTSRSWCVSATTANSSPRRHPANQGRVDAPAATATGSPAPTRPPGRHPTRYTAATTTSTDTSTCKPGTGYTRISAPTATPAAR
jgi:hypothetical protein